jgi:hypothetical protein
LCVFFLGGGGGGGGGGPPPPGLGDTWKDPRLEGLTAGVPCRPALPLPP